MNSQTAKEWLLARIGSRTRMMAVGLLLMGPLWAQAAEQESSDRAEGWQLQFEDNFDRPKLGPQWQTLEGSWYVVDGRLRGTGQVFCATPFSGDVRLEYHAMSRTPGDLSAVLCAGEKGLVDGVFFGFGSGRGTYGKLLIKGEEVVRYDAAIQPGKHHHVVCRLEGRTLTHEVDGQVALRYVADSAIADAAHTRVGLYIYSGGEMDNVKIYTRPRRRSSAVPARTGVVFAKPVSKSVTRDMPFGYEPQHDRVTEQYVTAHTPWARSYAKGPTRLLCIAPIYCHRDTVELAQRLEMKYDAVMTQTWTDFASDKAKLRRNHHVGREASRVAERLHSALRKEHDVIVMGSFKWEILPEEFRTEILNQVRSGTGLVVRPLPNEIQQFISLFETAERVDGSPLIAKGVPFSAIPIWQEYMSDQEAAEDLLLTMKYGQGRVVILQNFAGWGNTGYLTPADSGATPTAVWDLDYTFSLVARAVLWAGGKEPDDGLEAALTIAGKSVAGTIARDDLPSVKVAIKLAAGRDDAAITLDVSVRDLRDDIAPRIHTSEIDLESDHDAAKADLPRLPAGKYLIDVIARTKHAKSLDWFSIPLVVTSSQRIGEMTMDREFVEPGDELNVAVKLAEPARSGTTWVCRVTDSRKRLVHASSIGVPEGNNAAAVTIRFEHPRATLLAVRSELLVDGQTVDVGTAAVPVRYPAGTSNFAWMAWATKNFDPAGRHLPKVLHDVGFDVAFIANNPGAAGQFAAANLRVVPYATGYHSHKSKGEPPARVPCLSDPQTLEAERDKLIAVAKSIMPFGPVAYNLGDENTLCDGGFDLCFSSTCREEFRQFVRKTYETLDALNTEWGTSYASWDEIEPIAIDEARQTGRYAQWVDFRTSMENVFTRIHRLDNEALRTVDKTALSGPEHIGRAMNFNGVDWWKLCRDSRYMGPTTHLSVNIVRCFGQPGSFVGRFCGGYRGMHRYEAYCRWSPWFGLFHDQNSIWWFFHSGNYAYGSQVAAIAADLSPMPITVAMGDEVRRIRRGVFTLLSGCRRDHNGIAVLESQPSIHASLIDESFLTIEESAKSFINLLENIGLQYDFISTAQLTDGPLQQRGYKALILPCARALSSREKQKIDDFVRAGGLVIADVRPGVMDEHGKPTIDPEWNELFGIERSAIVPQAPVTKGRVAVGGRLGVERIDGELADMTVDGSVAVKMAKALGRCGQIPTLIVNEWGEGRTVLLNFTAPRHWWELEVEWYGQLAESRRMTNLADPRRKVIRSILAAALRDRGIAPWLNIDGKPDRAGPTLLGESVLYRSGDAVYLCLLRDPISPQLDSVYQSDTLTITLPEERNIYDVLGRKFLGRAREIHTTLRSGQAAIFALLSYDVLSVKVDSDAQTYQAGQVVPVTVQVRSTRDRSVVAPPGNRITGRQVVHVDVLDPSGKTLDYYAKNIITKGGRARMVIPLALNDAAGQWTVRANDVATGTEGMARFYVTPADKR